MTDDLELAISLSHTSASRTPLNRNSVQSTTSVTFVETLSQEHVDQDARVYFNSKSQNRRPQHNPGNSRDLLGGAGQAFRSPKSKGVVFTDGDLSNPKVIHHCINPFVTHTSRKAGRPPLGDLRGRVQ